MASTPASQSDRLGLCAALLGTFSGWLGQSEIASTAFPRPKALQLFKLILLQPEHQLHRDQALDVLWPQLAGSSATAQLYKGRCTTCVRPSLQLIPSRARLRSLNCGTR